MRVMLHSFCSIQILEVSNVKHSVDSDGLTLFPANPQFVGEAYRGTLIKDSVDSQFEIVRVMTELLDKGTFIFDPAVWRFSLISGDAGAPTEYFHKND